jgi:hypothetical protein
MAREEGGLSRPQDDDGIVYQVGTVSRAANLIAQ